MCITLVIYYKPDFKYCTFDGDWLPAISDPSLYHRKRIKLSDGRFLLRDSESLYFLSDNNKILKTVQIITDENSHKYIEDVIVLNSGRILVYCPQSRPNEFELHLLTSDGQLIIKIIDKTRRIYEIKEITDDRLLILFTGRKLEIWSEDLEPLYVLDGHKGGIYDATELDDGRILSWSNDETIRLWSSDGKSLGIIGGQSGGVEVAKQLSRGRVVSYADGEFATDTNVYIWNFQTDEVDLPLRHSGYPYTIIQLNDGRIVSCSWDETAILWSAEGQFLNRMYSKSGSIYGALELRNGHIITWSSMEHHVTEWDSQGELVEKHEAGDHYIWGAIRLKSGRIISYGWDDNLRIWTANMVELYVLVGHTQLVSGALELQDERILSWSGHYTIKEPPTLRIWSSDGEPLVVMEGHTQVINGALQLRDNRILSWSGDKTLRLWSSDGIPLSVLEGHTQSIRDVFELADGCILSSHSSFDMSESEILLWSPDGEFIRVVDEERGILISQERDEIFWDRKENVVRGYKQGRLIHEFIADTTIYAVCGTDDGDVVVGDHRGNIHFLKPR